MDTIKGVIDAQNTHPSAVLLKLRLFIALNENNRKYQDSKNQENKSDEMWGDIAKLYQSYLFNRNKLLLDKLTIEEEKTLLRGIEKADQLYFPSLISRLETILSPDKKKNVNTGITLPTKLDPAESLKEFDMKELFSYMDMSKVGEPGEVLQNPLSIACLSDSDFKAIFPKLYNGARHGDAETRQTINNILSLMEGSALFSSEEKGGKLIALSCLVKKICENPSKFPTKEAIIAAIDEHEKCKDSIRYYSNGVPYGRNDKRLDLQGKVVYEQILKHGENSRVSKKQSGWDMLKSMVKQSPLFASEEKKPKLAAIDDFLFNLSPEGDFDHPLPLDDDIEKRDKEWDTFFGEFLKEEKTLFEVTEEKQTPPVKMDQKKEEETSKRSEVLDKLEQFYGKIDSSTVYTFKKEKTVELLNAIREKMYQEIRSVSPDSLKIKNPQLRAFVTPIMQGSDLDPLPNSLQPEQIAEEVQNVKKLIEVALLLKQLAIEKQINQLNKNATADDSLKQLSKQKRRLKISDAIALFEIGSKETYKKITSLSDEQQKELDKEIGVYGVDTTRYAQLDGMVTLLEKLHACQPENREQKLLHQRLGEQFDLKRNYSTEINSGRYRSYLRYEMGEGILLRSIQVDVLNEILDEKNPLQLIEILGTGSGKTKVLSPMKQWLRRKEGARLVINVWPSQHYPVNSEDVRKQVVTNYGQRSDTMDFHRNMDSSLDNLKFLYRELLKGVTESRQVNSTPESLQSCELKLLELLYQHQIEEEELSEESIAVFQKILNVLSHSEIHVDEGHVNFSPKREVNFTVGKPSEENQKYVKLMSKIYKHLVSEELEKLVQLKSNQQHLLSDDQYKGIVAPAIAKALISELSIEKEQEDEYLQYVLGSAESIPAWLEKHNKKQEIALLRGELTVVLQNTLRKNTSVHYGLSKKNPEIEFAKPYNANDSCVENAEYDNTTEAFNKTYQTYLYQRLSIDQQCKLINYLVNAAKEESAKNPIDFPITKTKAYQFFSQHFPKDLTEKGLLSLSKEDINEHKDVINGDDDVMFYYINHVVAPQIQKYGNKIKSDSQNFRTLTNSLTTMTATPGSIGTYGLKQGNGKETNTIDKANDSEVLNTLNTKCLSNDHFQLIDSESPIEILDAIVSSLGDEDKNARMLIDIGSLFKGVSNETVAKVILEKVQLNGLKGVAFYDQHNNLMMLEESGNIVSFDQSQLKPNERFTYCDNKHMFGSDTKQSPDAKGICTFGLHTDLDDMLQGVGRLREFLKGQTAKWVTTQKTMEAIDPNYQKCDSSFGVIRDHAISNQGKREADDLYRSIKQQMRNEIRSVVMKKLREASSSKVSGLFGNLIGFLVDKVLSDPYVMYGQIQQSVTGAVALEEYRQQLIVQLKKKEKQFTKAEYQGILKELKGYAEKIEKLEPKLPKKVYKFEGELGTESEIQIQVESEVEQEIQTISNDTTGLHLRKETKWPQSLDLYKKNWLKPTSVNTVTSKVQRTWFSFFYDFTIKFFKVSSFFSKEFKNMRACPDIPFKLKIIVGAITTVIITINTVAFAILGLPVFLVLGPLALVGEPIACLFRAHKQVVNPTWFGVMAAKSCVKTPVPLYELGDVIKCHPEKEISGAYELLKDTKEQKIRFTNNILRKVPEDTSDFTMLALGKEQKTLHEILVIEETVGEEKQYTVIAGDQETDAKYWRQKLRDDKANDKKENVNKRNRKICLFDLNVGITQNGKNPINEQELKKNSHFQQILVKLKLYNGDVQYKEEEEAQLQNMASSSKERAVLQKFLKRTILYHDVKKKEFTTSRVNRILSNSNDRK